jgi:hypothetical protein
VPLSAKCFATELQNRDTTRCCATLTPLVVPAGITLPFVIDHIFPSFKYGRNAASNRSYSLANSVSKAAIPSINANASLRLSSSRIACSCSFFVCNANALSRSPSKYFRTSASNKKTASVIFVLKVITSPVETFDALAGDRNAALHTYWTRVSWSGVSIPAIPIGVARCA